MAALDFPASPTVGQIYANPTTGASYSWNGTAWVQLSFGAGLAQNTFTATLGQTIFTPGVSYTPGLIDVFQNGVKLVLGVDYTATNGTTIVLAAPAALGDTIQTICYAAVAGSNVYTKAEIDARIGTQGSLRRNRLHNGEGMISQVWGATAVTPTISYSTLDRWLLGISQASKLTVQQGNSGGVSPDSPFFHYIGVAAAYTPLAADNFVYQQGVEGLNIRDFRWGTAAAKPVTLSFWVVTNLAGTYGVAFRNKALTRSYVTSFVLPASGATKVMLTIPGCTDGVWDVDGTAGLYISLDLGCGANFNAPLLNAWSTGSYVSHASLTKLVANTGKSINFSDLQLEVGSVATPFERGLYPDALRDCLRYRQSLGNIIISTGYAGAGAGWHEEHPLSEWMRATPTHNFSGITYNNSSNLTLNSSSHQSIRPQVTATAAGQAWCIFSVLLEADI